MLRVLAASESLTIKEFAKSGNANARKWQAPDVSRRFDVVYVSLEWHQTVTLVHSAFNRIDFRRLFRRTNEAHTTTANNAGNTALNDEISARTLLSTVPPKATREQNCPRTAVRGTTNNSLGTLINPVDHRTRWTSCTQLVSQMTPLSGENACSKQRRRGDLGPNEPDTDRLALKCTVRGKRPYTLVEGLVDPVASCYRATRPRTWCRTSATLRRDRYRPEPRKRRRQHCCSETAVDILRTE
jgi:hypothetical protein